MLFQSIELKLCEAVIYYDARPVYRIKGQEEMIKRNLGNFENKPFTLLQAVISWNRVNLFQNCKKSGYESFTYNVFSYYNSHTVGGMKIFYLHQR